MPTSDSLLSEESESFKLLDHAARDLRIVVFCGIPGMGKSFLIREQVKRAMAHRRRVTLLQWDVARKAFERVGAERFPEVEGATHPVIRRAAGLWIRPAVRNWSESHTQTGDMLLIEAPIIEGRFTELAQRFKDDTESLLNAETTRFFVPTPSVAVRKLLQDARAQESGANRHPRDADNATPQVADALWSSVSQVATSLAIASLESRALYSPGIYFAVYEAALRHRRPMTLPVTEASSKAGSPHDIRTPVEELVPRGVEVFTFLQAAASEGEPVIAARTARWFCG